MKLTIEVELQADEIPAATELLTILQQLSQNVTVKTIAASLPLPNAKPVLTALISKLEDSTKLDAITQEINTALVSIHLNQFRLYKYRSNIKKNNHNLFCALTNVFD